DEETALFGTAYSDLYDNSIRWVDRVLARLIREIDARGLREKTLIVVAADHGEAFGEHGREGHARDVYGEVTTTPFVLSLPFRLEPGIVVDSPTQNVDIWPTLLEVDLAEAWDLVAELPGALLGPRLEERAAVVEPAACADPLRCLGDDCSQAGPVHADERVPEVERHGPDAGQSPRLVSVGAIRHLAALDGQISRNGQYVHASGLGLGR
ncbi:MAG: sulfatase-like hydrolase/transferase, partial [Chloroflexi bacterium]|nr:sulfatase-like hydrolase/transferase [Chloroflexota bacterium]